MPSGAPTIRVHHVIDSLTWGGAEMLLSELAAGAPEAGIEMSVAYLREVDGSPAAAGLRRLGVEPTCLDLGRMRDLSSLPSLRRHLAGLRPDIVHTHLDLADTLALPAAWTLGLPAVSTIHLLAGRATGRAADASARGILRIRLAAEARRRAASRIIAVSDAARDAYLAAALDRPGHIVTVHNGVRRADADGSGIRAGLGIADDAILVTTVSVLRPHKGHDVALDAVAELRSRFPALVLLILGDGPAREEIARRAAPLGDAVVMSGHRDDVPAILSASDIVLHATDVDAFPTALLEAAAARVPVVATRVGGIPEIVEDEKTGILVPAPPTSRDVAVALARLLDDASLRAELGAQARARYDAQFTARRWAERLRVVYDEVRGPRRRARRDGRGWAGQFRTGRRSGALTR